MRTVQERFVDFDARHPEVFDRLVAMALRLRARGFRQYSVKILFGVLRYEIDIRPDADGWKLNDIYHARYARKIMDEVPELAGFFKLRALRVA